MWIADLSTVYAPKLHSLSGCHIPLSTCPITPEPCIRQLGTVPIPQSPLPLFNPANPILFTLPHPFLSAETTVEALVYVLPSLPLLPDWPCAPFSIMVPTMAWSALFSWDLWVTNYIFSGNHLLTVASTHLSNNKTYKAQHLWWAAAERTILKDSLSCSLKRMKPGFWSLQGISTSLQNKLVWKTFTQLQWFAV